MGAARTWRHDGHAIWNPRNADVQKAADDETEKKKEGNDHTLTVPQAVVSLNYWSMMRVGWLNFPGPKRPSLLRYQWYLRPVALPRWLPQNY